MRNFWKRILIFPAILSSLLFFLVPSEVFALTFDPSFGVTVVDTTAGASSNLTGKIEQSTFGQDLVKSVTFSVPAGWQIAAGSGLGTQIVGGGSYSIIDTASGATVTGTISIANDTTNIPTGAVAHWIASFVPTPPIPPQYGITMDGVVRGNSSSGYSIAFTRSVVLKNSTPATTSFTFYGKTASNLSVFTNPTIAGNYVWTASMTSDTGLTATKSQTLSMPGSVTPAGSNVTVPLGNNVSVTFATVSSTTQTSIATSTTSPPSGTGQFQLSGGLYYDFTIANPSATACPCTVTLPYDPVTTPSPRIYHLQSGVWVDSTTSVDTVNHTVTGIVSSFSFFAVGQPNFSVFWANPISKLIQKKGNPFALEKDEDLGIKFGLLDSNNQTTTAANVSVEIWQTNDESGAAVAPVKVATLTPEFNTEKSRYQTELDLEKTPLGLGTYQIRVIVGNTVASQQTTASFKLTNAHQDHEDYKGED